jgi:hypothetical protein
MTELLMIVELAFEAITLYGASTQRRGIRLRDTWFYVLQQVPNRTAFRTNGEPRP